MTTSAPTSYDALVSLIQAAVAEQPDIRLKLLNAVTDAIQDASDENVPEVEIGSLLSDHTVYNPRTHEHDRIIVVDVSQRWTPLDDEDFDRHDKSVTVDYDGSADYEGLLYMTESDELPVRLPEDWFEN